MAKLGVSLMVHPDFQIATLPLFDSGKIEYLEWSFDTAWGRSLPEWADELITFYANNSRLLGHGVSYSLLSAEDDQHHNDWVERLATEFQERAYTHLTEHFGFMRGGDFHRSAPLPVPLMDTTLDLALSNIERLKKTAGVAVGIENLAFAYSADDVRSQAQFLNEISTRGGTFLLLDLHNLYCQMENFGLTAEEALDLYSEELPVKELHVSGGSWSEAHDGTSKKIRRDTHDGAVPSKVFSLLERALQRYPGVEAVIFEQLPESLNTPEARSEYQNDFHRLAEII